MNLLKQGILIADTESISKNLLQNSTVFSSGGCASGNTKTILSDGTAKIVAETSNNNYVRFSDCDTTVALSQNDTFTFSIVIKSDDSDKKPTVYLRSGLGYYSMSGTMSSDWTTIYYTGTWTQSSFLTNLHLGFGSAPGTYYIKSFKLEKGDKPTIWTPYLETSIEPQGFIEGSNIFKVFNGHYESNEFIEW